MKKLLLILPVLLMIGVTTQPAYAAVSLSDILHQVVQLRAEVASLKAQLQIPSTTKKLVKKAVKTNSPDSVSKGESSTALKSADLPYDVYAIGYLNSGNPKMQVWALDAAENLVFVGNINTNVSQENACPYAPTQSLAMDDTTLYYTANNSAPQNSMFTYKLVCDSATSICSCNGAPSLTTSGTDSFLWGTAVANMFGVDNFVMGVNSFGPLSSSTSSVKFTPTTSPAWTNIPLITPTGAPLAGPRGDIVQVGPDTIMTNSGGNSVNSLVTMTNPGMSSVQNIGSAGVKSITGLAYKMVNGQPTVYSFTNALAGSSYGRVWKHVLNADRTAIISSVEIGQAPAWTAFHDAASKPVFQPPVLPPQHDPFDFGDAPDLVSGTGPGNYKTSFADNGPYMSISTSAQLGRCADTEMGEQLYNGTTFMDDLLPAIQKIGVCSLINGGTDDEDGVQYIGTPKKGTTIKTVFTTPINLAYVTGWIDFNGNGDFSDPGEMVQNAVPIGLGSTSIDTFIPDSATTGDTYARYIVKPDNSPAQLTGYGGIGEVEDYKITITN